ncbi:hypothetical protein AB0F77_13310 [Streptomyces sp. NPDC026672]|uniref:hypothetical protein n=1 Tax=unclassified Streptomyces TaxID=2593676 RepID=UPI0033ED0183
MSSHESRDRQLTLLCRSLPGLRRLSRGPVGAARRLVIERAVRAARAGAPLDEHLEALGLSRARTAVPVAEGEEPRTTVPRVAEAAPRALLGVHVCPLGVCDRREPRAAGEELPVCEVFDLALRFDAEG